MAEPKPEPPKSANKHRRLLAAGVVAAAFCLMIGAGALVAGSGSSSAPPTGTIEGASLDRSLKTVTVRNLAVTFSQCGSESKARCQWAGVAVLAPRSLDCPVEVNGSLSVWSVRTGARLVWNLESSVDGTVESDLIAIPSLGTADEQLCLFASVRGPAKLGQQPPRPHLELVDTAPVRNSSE